MVVATRHHYRVERWGVGELVVADGVVLSHDLPQPQASRARDGRGEDAGLVAELTRRVRAHLGGAPTAYDDVSLDLSWCTPFQAELAGALRGIPWGEIVSYGELAALAGRPGAARAAGSFCAQNRFALMLPCHRVVSATGIGGYGPSGLPLKRRLLALEGIEL